MWVGRRQGTGAVIALVALVRSALPVAAADFPDIVESAPPHTAPLRFFPRGDGADVVVPLARPYRRLTCAPRAAPVPTDAPDDPSYVGSPYGLGKPSYYGFRPGLGHDDPYGRPLRYCP